VNCFVTDPRRNFVVGESCTQNSCPSSPAQVSFGNRHYNSLNGPLESARMRIGVVSFTLRVHSLAVLVELFLQGFLIFLAVRPMPRATCFKRNLWTSRAIGFNRNVNQPSRNPQKWFLHPHTAFFARPPFFPELPADAREGQMTSLA
jgi:hypothetical protein